MVSPHLELPTLASAVNNLPALMDDQTNLLDQALQGDLDFSVAAGGTIVIAKSDSLRNFMFNLTGAPGADFNLDFPTNNRYFAINNKSGKIATIRIDGGGGTTVEVVDAEQRVIYIDGTDVIDITGIGVPNLETLVTLTGDFTISDTTLTPIDWDAETRDEGSWHDNVTDPEQIKIGAGIVDAVAKIHITGLDAETITCKLQRYNSSDALQETLFEENREHDGVLDLIFNLSVINIRAAAGDYLTVEIKSEADTTYKIESDDSYFLVRRATTGGAVGDPFVFSGAKSKRITSTFACVSGGDGTPVEFNGEDYDTDSYHNNSTNPERMTIQAGVADAYYRVTCGYETASYGASHIAQPFISLNNENYPGRATSYKSFAGGTSGKSDTLTTTLIMSANEFISLRLLHSRGSDVLVDANDASFMTIERLGFV